MDGLPDLRSDSIYSSDLGLHQWLFRGPATKTTKDGEAEKVIILNTLPGDYDIPGKQERSKT